MGHKKRLFNVIISELVIVSLILNSLFMAFPVRTAQAAALPPVSADAEAGTEPATESPDEQGNGDYFVYMPFVAAHQTPPATAPVTPDQGGVLASFDGDTTVTFDTGVVTQTATASYQAIPGMTAPDEQVIVGEAFELALQGADGQAITHLSPRVSTHVIEGVTEYVVTNTVHISLAYSDEDVAGLDESRLRLHYQDEHGDWVPMLTLVDAQANVARIPTDHFTQFALLAPRQVLSSTVTVVLDPAHGGTDLGGEVTSPASYAIEEKMVNLDTALAVKGYLEQCGVQVELTREDDSTVELVDRAAFINQLNPDLAATIGTNIAAHNMSYFVGGPMGLADLSKPEHEDLARLFVHTISDTTQLPPDRGVNDARTWRGGLYVPTHVTTTLYAQIETAFLDSYNDRDKVIDPHLEYIAGGIYNGIITQLQLTACVPFSQTIQDERLDRTLGLGAGVRYTAQGVNPATGNQFQWFRDLFVPGAGLNVDIVRYYNSQSDEIGMFGKGWSSLYDMRVEVTSEAVRVKYADGRWGTFTPDGSGGYDAEPGVFDTLTEENGGYVLTTPEQIRFEFDGAGVLQAIRDESGQALTLTYASGHLDAIVDASGRAFDIVTNGSGLVTNITDPAGRVVTYTYGTVSMARTQYLQNLRGARAVTGGTDLLQMTNANGGDTQYAYDAAGGYLNRVTDPMGITYLENQYTPDGRVASQKNGNGDDGEWDYDLANMQATFTDNEGNQTIYYFDSKYRVIKEKDALGYTVEYEYDANDNITMRKDKRGNVWRYTYDARGNMLTQTDPLDQWSLYDEDVTTWTYDDQNNPVSMTDALSHTWTYTYDDQGNPTYVREPNGAETFAEYDDKGQMTKLIDAEGRETRFEYDEHGNRTKTWDAEGGWTASTYDEAGHELTRTECLNPPACSETRTTTFEYDDNGNVTKEIDPMSAETTYTYDENNLLIKKVDRRGGVWEYEYDDELNPTLERDPLGQETTHTYNKMSKRLSTTDPEGRTTTFEYDPLYRMIKVTDPARGVYTYDYDPNGNLLALTDPLGHTTRFTYDVVNRRKFVHDAIGGTTEYCYDPLDRIVTAFDPRRAKVQLTYDSVGNQVEVIDPLGNRMVMAYDQVHNMTRQTVGIPAGGVQADGATTQFEFDDLNREITRTDPISRTTHTAYDGVGNVVETTDPMGFVTTFKYNKNGWMETATDALGGVTAYTYDPEGATETMTDARGHTTRYEYDKAGQLLQVTDPLSQVTSFEYDKVGNQIAVINALNQTTRYEYNVLDLLIKETDPLNHDTTYAYDALRRMTARTDANEITTRYSYNPLGWLTRVTDAEDGVTTYEYDAVGNRTAIVDANGVRTTFEYNYLDQLKREINPLDKTWEYSYDARGNMVRRVDGKWQATYYEYDKANQLIATVYGEGANMPAVTFEYDANGNEVAMHDWNGDWQYTYDALNRRTSATDYLGRTLQWEYDAVGNRTAMIYPNGERVEMAYDAANQLETLTDFENRAHTWDYDPLGYIQAQVNPNSTRAEYAYDAAGRLTRLTNTGPGDAIIARYDYTLDAVGNRVQTQEQRGPESITRQYSYDDLYRLTRAQTNTGQDMRYIYDPVGNRLQKTGVPEPVEGQPQAPEDTPYTYNALNSMLSAGPTAFDYDDNGNRMRKTEPLTATDYVSVALTSGWALTGTVVTEYAYDYENRLTGVTRAIHYTKVVTDGTALLPVQHISPTMEAHYVYDGYGRRVEKHVTTTITATSVLTAPQLFHREYAFDGLDPVVEYDYADGPTTPTLESQYVYGNGRMVLLARTEDGTTDSYWYHYDGLGSVVALTDESGADVCQWKYDEYGNPLQDCPELNHYTYTGQEVDPETGLVHFFARYYDTETGVWITLDLHRGDPTSPLTLVRYQYTANNPINCIDEYGYFWHIVGGAAVGAITGAAGELIGQTVSNIAQGENAFDYDWKSVGAAAAGGAVEGAVLAATGNPYLASAAGGFVEGATDTLAHGGSIKESLVSGTSNALTSATFEFGADQLGKQFKKIDISDAGEKFAKKVDDAAGQFKKFTRSISDSSAAKLVKETFDKPRNLLDSLTKSKFAKRADDIKKLVDIEKIRTKPKNWQGAEKIVAKHLNLDKNTIKFEINSRNRIPDFVDNVKKPRFFADSKLYRKSKLRFTDQLKDFVSLAEKNQAPFYLFVSKQTKYTDDLYKAVKSTGGDIVKLFD